MVQVDKFDFGKFKDAYTLRFAPGVEIGDRDPRSMMLSEVGACALLGKDASVDKLDPNTRAQLIELDELGISPGEVTVALQKITNHFVSIA